MSRKQRTSSRSVSFSLTIFSCSTVPKCASSSDLDVVEFISNSILNNESIKFKTSSIQYKLESVVTLLLTSTLLYLFSNKQFGAEVECQGCI